jgi:glycosyltransferase involved in cell wall biosynthesis
MGDGLSMSGPQVSVVVAFHDRVAYLAEAIRSVLAEAVTVPLDVVLVDDGSTDGSAEAARSFVPPARYLRQPNQGCASAWNAGLAAASAEFVAFCDSDDVWVAGRLERMLAPFVRDPSTEVVFGRVDEFVSPELDPSHLSVRAPRTDTFAPLAGTMLARRAVFERVGLFDAGLVQGYWVDWYARMRDAELNTVVIPDVVLRRRLHRTNSSLERRDQMGEFARALHQKLTRRRSRS